MSARECPWCKSWEQVTEEDGISEPGDFTICYRCLNLVVLKKDGAFRRATGGESSWIFRRADVRQEMVDAHMRRKCELGAMIQ